MIREVIASEKPSTSVELMHYLHNHLLLYTTTSCGGWQASEAQKILAVGSGGGSTWNGRPWIIEFL
ncbi:hypothetical protein ACJX0J_024910, partial [Zea mays]